MREKDMVRDQIAALEQTVAFFAGDKKQERERWVVDSFLNNVNQRFREEEIVSTTEEPPDVLFREGRFEIKEVMDEGRRRHAELKQELAKARTATSTKDFLRSYTPRDTTIQELYERCLSEVEKLNVKYAPSTRANLDLLFYVNLIDVEGVAELPFPDTTDMATHGWRSVSFINGHRACCFVASPGTPGFILEAHGKIVHRRRP